MTAEEFTIVILLILFLVMGFKYYYLSIKYKKSDNLKRLWERRYRDLFNQHN